MKKITNYLQALILCALFGLSFQSTAQSCVANFSYTIGSNGNVTFTSTSVGTSSATQYFWSFGNGSTYNNNGQPGANASVQYTANGTYVVNLFYITVPTCSAGTQQTITITNTSNNCNLNANFSITQGANGLVNFNNTSTGTLPGATYLWQYGDNSTNGTTANTAHVYSTNGTYIATLTVNNNQTPQCVSTRTMSIIVNSNCVLNAGVTISQGSNGQVIFTSTSTGTVSSTVYSWAYGNGTFNNNTSYNGPVTVTFLNGSYTATLTVKNSSINPTCISSATVSFVVTSNTNTCTLNAAFLKSPNGPAAFTFTNTSTGTNANTTYFWKFGDGNTSTSAGSTVNHTYAGPGSYQVRLIIMDSQNPTCIDSVQQTAVVMNNTCTANAVFSLVPSGTPQLWNAFPGFPNNVTAATWNWGDGTSTNTLYTSHQYSVSATYSICLTVTVNCGASASFCVAQFINRSAGENNLMYTVNVLDPATVGLKEVGAETASASIYPNPSNGTFEVKTTNLSGAAKVQIYNLVGDKVYETEVVTGTDVSNSVNFKDAAQGIYLVKIISADKAYTQKIAITK